MECRPGRAYNWQECCIAPYCITLYNTVLHCIALHCTTLYYTVLHCIALYCITLYCTVLHCIALHCITLYCTVLHYTVLHCIALHCFTLYSAVHCLAQCTALRCSVETGREIIGWNVEHLMELFIEEKNPAGARHCTDTNLPTAVHCTASKCSAM